MAFVQVKNTLQTWKLAAFIVAFFSSFFSHSYNSVNDSGIQQVVAKTERGYSFDCNDNRGLVIGGGSGKGEPPNVLALHSICIGPTKSKLKSDMRAYMNGPCTGSPSIKSTEENGNNYYITGTYPISTCGGGCGLSTSGATTRVGNMKITESEPSCPPEGSPSYLGVNDFEGITSCYDPADLEEYLRTKQEDKHDDDKCKNLVLDSGNNSADDMCHTSVSGNSCEVTKVSGSDFSYYKGTGASEGGCFSSDKPPYDSDGTGSGNDNCIYTDSGNYCEASKQKHCSTTQGTEICDDGCIDDGTTLFCDTSKHPDVGEGDSDFFNDSGTCSVISASSSKGFCEDSGGTWDETSDYQETSCPIGAGTCSIATAGLCNACFDAGGTWTPDPNAPLTTQEKVGIETAALIKDSNDKLSQIEHGQRKTMESMQSTIKSGNDKVVSAIEALGEKLSEGETKEEEKESFTTTTETTDKSAFKAMFDSSAQAAVKARIVTAQAEYDSKINSILAEAKTIFTVTVPTAVGYQVRNIQLSYGSVDASLSRYSDFFKTLSGPIMLLCSLIAALAILRD